MLGRVVHIDPAFSFVGNYEEDKATLIRLAESPTTAAGAHQHAEVVTNLFHYLTHGTPSAPDYPVRTGLVRKVFDELFPIAHFARLHFFESEEVKICWQDGNQNFDATVEDLRSDSCRSSIRYLEVTTLQDRQDVDLLKSLAKEGTVVIDEDNDLSDHLRKVGSLKVILEKKGKKEYPPDTALIIYTDENRFKKFSVGSQPAAIDKKNGFGQVLEEMKYLLTGFSEVFIYSNDEIYASLSTKPE